MNRILRWLDWVWNGDRPPAEPEPDVEPLAPVSVLEFLTLPDFEAIRQAAIHIASKHYAGRFLERIEPDLQRWLRTLDRHALCVVACASDRRLRRHIRGIEYIRGLRPADKATVDLYLEAMKRPKFAAVSGGDGRRSGGGLRVVTVQQALEEMLDAPAYTRSPHP